MDKLRDYSNMPTISCDDKNAIDRLKLQIKRQEPAIFELPEKINLAGLEKRKLCNYDEEQKVLFNCDPENILPALTADDSKPFLQDLIKPSKESGTRIDVDLKNSRIIFHD